MAIYTRNEQGQFVPMNFPTLKGEKGKDGITPNLTIGTVTTLEPEQQATVTIGGTKENPVLDFGIPRGKDGTDEQGGSGFDDSTISTKKTWSSAKIENFVLTNDEVVWTDVNGENGSINYTKEGYLREIEVWGNTIQDEEDLSNIQHLGELYVDDEGEPKLDSQDRKQYKIEVEVTNASYNLFNLSNVATGKDIDPTGILVDKSSDSICLDYIPVTEGDKIFVSGGIWKKIIAYDENKKYFRRIYDDSRSSGSCIIPKGVSFIRLGCGMPNLNAIKISKIMFVFGDKQREYKENYISYENRIKNKTTLLLPCQLMKVGNVSDRLYWDNKKSRYIVEKNIGLYKDFSSLGERSPLDNVKYYYIDKNKIINDKNKHDNGNINYIAKGFKNVIYNYYRIDEVNMFDSYHLHNFSFLKSMSLDEVKNSLKDSHILYQAEIPQLIETDITEELKLPTFINTTYVSVNGGVQGSIKAKAPVDGGQAISNLTERNMLLEQENQEIKAVNEAQDIEIELNQEAINFMLFQSTSMQLSEPAKGMNMIAVYLANQILKGRLDYALVVSQYGEFKEDIDTVLMSKEMMLSQENVS